MLKAVSVVAVLGLCGMAQAQLVTTRVDSVVGTPTLDGTIGPSEYGPGNSYSYAGGGSGFGGALGNGVLYMKSDATNLYFGFQAGGDLNDNVVIMLDTRAGGFTDAQMNDTADGGRMASSNQSVNADDAYGILPDFSVVIGGFGIVSFELNAGSTPGHLGFVDYNGTFTGNNPAIAREYTLPLATLGLAAGANVDFFMAYISETGYGSNESIPAGPINGGNNVGFDPTSPGYPTWDRFTVAPAPSSLGLIGLAGLAAARRRRA